MILRSPWTPFILAGAVLLGDPPAVAQRPQADGSGEGGRAALRFVEKDLAEQYDRLITVQLANRPDDAVGAVLMPADEALRSHLALPERHGLVVSAVVPNGPAARVGLQPNDVLITLGGTLLSEPDDLAKALKAAGEKAQPLALMRGGKRITLQVRPELRVTLAPAGPEKLTYFIGVQASPIDETLRSHLDLPPEGPPRGLMVNDVIADSPAARAGLHKNDILLKVGDEALMAPEDLVARVQASGGKPVALALIRGGKPATLQVTPEPRKADAEVQLSAQPDSQGAVLLWRNLVMNPGGDQTWTWVAPQNLNYADPALLGRIYYDRAGQVAGPDRIERRLDELSEQVKKLSATLDELRSSSKPDAKAGPSK